MDNPIVKQSTLFGESEDAHFQPYKGYRFGLSSKGQSYCSCCKKMKSTDEFSPSKLTTNGFSYYCKLCVKIKGEPYKEARTASCWQKRYGITAEEYQAMFDKQAGVCAICGNAETTVQRGVIARLSVDHDHVTGKVRGLLCQQCNHGLGHFKDNTEILSNAIDYLMKNTE